MAVERSASSVTSAPGALDLHPVQVWRCPVCRGELRDVGDALRCSTCSHDYEMLLGIPDLRDPRLETTETLRDAAAARNRAAILDSLSAEDAVRSFFAEREGEGGWTARDTAYRTRNSVAATQSLRHDVRGWLSPAVRGGKFLDLGCGFGSLIAAAHADGITGIGIDNRMDVLVIARKLIESAGGRSILAAGNAESLPLADESIDGVVMYDVIEHIEALSAALAEVSRVIRKGGVLACRTPNRYSLAAEPHVFVWGVGWLPRRYQRRFVRWRSGRAYPQTWLLSPAEVRGIIEQYTGFDAVMTAPPIADYELETFTEPRSTVARVYNAFTRRRWAQWGLLRIGPLFQTIATKARVNPPAP